MCVSVHWWLDNYKGWLTATITKRFLLSCKDIRCVSLYSYENNYVCFNEWNVYIGAFWAILLVMQRNATLRFAVSRVFSLVKRNISFLWTSTLPRLNPAKGSCKMKWNFDTEMRLQKGNILFRLAFSRWRFFLKRSFSFSFVTFVFFSNKWVTFLFTFIFEIFNKWNDVKLFLNKKLRNSFYYEL